MDEETLVRIGKAAVERDSVLEDLRTSGWAEAASGFTCSEARALSTVFLSIGAPDIADGIMQCHAYGDDDCDDEHHDGYLAATKKSCECQVKS